MRRNLGSSKRAHLSTQYDIKLELDVRCQKVIEKTLRKAFPTVSILGEEGTVGTIYSEYRWVVDPIDGTMNFAYGIPHACVSIALQQLSQHRSALTRRRCTEELYPDGYQTLVGVIYDPFCDELWTAILGQPARLNGQIIHVSSRRKLAEALIAMGFAKSRKHLEASLPVFNRLVHRVRKVRSMGAGALALVYVATGRFDAYLEAGIRLWDIAAGGLILQCAGGEFWRKSIAGQHAYRLVASNGLLRGLPLMPR
jgi:myo-inositol-1(or 4)-monophosphatase